MKVLVDTVVWSFVFRRHVEDTIYKDLLGTLIADGRVLLLGAVRQEILSGIRHEEQFERLRLSLNAFPNIPITIADYELAAFYYNLCRKNGVQGSNTDFLICAISVNHNCEILTTDKDFEHFAELLPINLFKY